MHLAKGRNHLTKWPPAKFLFVRLNPMAQLSNWHQYFCMGELKSILGPALRTTQRCLRLPLGGAGLANRPSQFIITYSFCCCCWRYFDASQSARYSKCSQSSRDWRPTVSAVRLQKSRWKGNWSVAPFLLLSSTHPPISAVSPTLFHFNLLYHSVP